MRPPQQPAAVKYQKLTMPYTVAFWTISNPNPERLGTAEDRVAQVMVWATDADEAINIVKEKCKAVNRQYGSTISADVQGQIARELIINDELCTMDLREIR